MRSNLWLDWLRMGRAFRFDASPFGLRLETGLGNIYTTRNSFASNRSLVEAIGITQQLHTYLNQQKASRRKNGYLPTLNVPLTYRLGGRPW